MTEPQVLLRMDEETMKRDHPIYGVDEAIATTLAAAAVAPPGHVAAIYPGQIAAWPETAKALTYDTGKPPLAWLPWAAVKAMNRVQQYGHAKYKDFNNYRKGMEVSRNLSCALRHIEEYMEGHDKDAESGENPLAHAMCRIAFVLQNINDGKAIDDRYKP